MRRLLRLEFEYDDGLEYTIGMKPEVGEMERELVCSDGFCSVEKTMLKLGYELIEAYLTDPDDNR